MDDRTFCNVFAMAASRISYSPSSFFLLPFPHSALSASTGSTRIARRAGR
jgi:hypothetical protein